MSGKNESGSGLKEYFPALYDLKPAFFAVKFTRPYAVGGYSNLEAFRLRIEELYKRDYNILRSTLPNHPDEFQYQTLDTLILQLRDLKARLVIKENGKFKFFLRTEIVKRDKEERERRHEILAELSDYADLFSEEIDGLIRRLSELQDAITLRFIEKPKTKISRIPSFPYKKYNTDPDRLKDLRTQLKNAPLILEIPQKDFDLIFSGDEINTPIRWIGKPNTLHYFIDRINNYKSRAI